MRRWIYYRYKIEGRAEQVNLPLRWEIKLRRLTRPVPFEKSLATAERRSCVSWWAIAEISTTFETTPYCILLQGTERPCCETSWLGSVQMWCFSKPPNKMRDYANFEKSSHYRVFRLVRTLCCLSIQVSDRSGEWRANIWVGGERGIARKSHCRCHINGNETS